MPGRPQATTIFNCLGVFGTVVLEEEAAKPAKKK
jgi:hypothetical protein